jgi:hypothetical protein
MCTYDAKHVLCRPQILQKELSCARTIWWIGTVEQLVKQNKTRSSRSGLAEGIRGELHLGLEH